MEYQIINLAYALLIGIVTNLAGKWVCEKWDNIPRLAWWVAIWNGFSQGERGYHGIDGSLLVSSGSECNRWRGLVSEEL